MLGGECKHPREYICVCVCVCVCGIDDSTIAVDF